MNGTEPEQLLKTAEDLKRGGWIVAILGAAGALCRHERRRGEERAGRLPHHPQQAR